MASPMLNQLLGYASQMTRSKQWELFSTTFVRPAEPAFVQLAAELGAVQDVEQALQRAKLPDELRDILEILKKHLLIVQAFPKQNWGELYDMCNSMLTLLRQFYQRSRGPTDWFCSSMKRIVLAGVETCTAADRATGTKERRAAYAGGGLAQLLGMLGVLGKTKKTLQVEILFLCGIVIKLNLQLGVSGSLMIANKVAAPAIPSLHLAPRADQVRFGYWAGRWHIFEHRVGPAYVLLTAAFNACPNFHQRNKRLVLISLCAAAIPLGIFPHPDLLRLFNLDKQFLPVINAMKAGDAIALSLAIDSPEALRWFSHYSVHSVLKEKCIVILWRNLVRKAYVFHSKLGVDRENRVPLTQLSVAFRYSYDVDEGWDPKDIVSLLASLITQGYIKGQVLEERWLSLRSGSLADRFPAPSGVRQTAAFSNSIWGVKLLPLRQ